MNLQKIILNFFKRKKTQKNSNSDQKKENNFFSYNSFSEMFGVGLIVLAAAVVLNIIEFICITKYKNILAQREYLTRFYLNLNDTKFDYLSLYFPNFLMEKSFFAKFSDELNFEYISYSSNKFLNDFNKYNLYLLNYSKVLGFFLLALILALVLTILANVLSRTTRSRKTRSKQVPDFEKNSAYECGFEPFEDARNSFDVNFYLVALLFILFDLEIVFLFPWCLFSYFCNGFEYIILIIFIYVLTLGFVYEWKKGALEWY